MNAETFHQVWVRRKLPIDHNGFGFPTEFKWSEWTHVSSYRSAAIALDTVASFQRINPAREYKIEKGHSQFPPGF